MTRLIVRASKSAVILALFVAFLGVSPTHSQNSCTVDSDCAQGQICLNNLCRDGSGNSCANYPHTCPDGEHCTSDRCVIPQCKAHCDCPQGQFCYYGECLYDPKTPVYCCSNPGCQAGRWCFQPDGQKGVCAEDPSQVCQNACDCGPAHCCKYSATVQHNVCVKDIDDPWMPGGTEIGPSCVLGIDATYCAADPLCDAGELAYFTSGQVADFRSFEASSNTTQNFCGGKPCYAAQDCDPGQSCIDSRPGSPAAARSGASCSAEGGFCKSNAVAEAVWNISPADLIPACAFGTFFGQRCDLGWSPGGVYAVQRAVATSGSCGNTICDPWETGITCAEDCRCGDGVCDTAEVGSCQADCGSCGDGICQQGETHKNCPADCRIVCGDGSCDTGEASACPQDCGCSASATYADTRVWCGDGLCQASGNFPENAVIPESALNCPLDCAIGLAITPSTVSVCEGSNTQVTLTYVVTNNYVVTDKSVIENDPHAFDLSGSVVDNKLGSVGTFGPLAVGASATLTKMSSVSSTTFNTATAVGTFKHFLTNAYARATATITARSCDTTPPSIGLTCPGTVNLNATGYAYVDVTDAESGVASQSAPNGDNVLDTSTVGAKTFTVTGADKAGNTTSNSCTYKVIYDFLGAGGFGPPLGNPPTVNAAKAGSTIPVKWQLPDGKGGFIGDLGSVTGITFQQVQCADLSATLTAEVPATASGSSGLHYDATTNQFVYNWKTSSTMTGKCYVLTLRLNDGGQYQVNVSLK